MESPPIHQCVLQAWRASLPRKLPWIFGAVIALAGIAETQFGAGPLLDTFSLEESFKSLAGQDPQEALLIALIFVSLSIVGMFGKSNLIVALGFVADKPHLPNHPDTAKAIGTNFLRGLLLESIAFLAFLIVIGILAIPPLIAASYNPEALPLLVLLSLITLVPLALILFFIKQFSLFYLLLSPLRIRGAIEVGSSLLYRRIAPSLLFGLFSFALSVLFTFCANLVILVITVLFDKISIPLPETYASLAIGFALFAWFAVFQQALWIAFFKSIAGPRDTEEPIKEKESVPIGNDTLPEIPPAQ
ncbi:MAG: hypothetical protein WAW00_00205 [Candidatus Moraniibacteriota bacterium]